MASSSGRSRTTPTGLSVGSEARDPRRPREQTARRLVRSLGDPRDERRTEPASLERWRRRGTTSVLQQWAAISSAFSGRHIMTTPSLHANVRSRLSRELPVLRPVARLHSHGGRDAFLPMRASRNANSARGRESAPRRSPGFSNAALSSVSLEQRGRPRVAAANCANSLLM
jgi:hypothetical protein